MKILFYYPSNKRTNAMETLILALRAEGHELVLLTSCEKGDFHAALEMQGIKTYTTNVSASHSLLFYLKNVTRLRKFCRQHKIDVVFSHLQRANIVAVYAQRFSRSRYFIFRHHGRYGSSHLTPGQRNELRFDNIINRKARVIYVPSSGVKSEMLEHEQVDESKIKIIPYVYDFSRYPVADPRQVQHIQNETPQSFRILYCSRFVSEKRPLVAVEAVLHLLRKGHPVHMFLLDEGPELEKVKAICQGSEYADHFHFLGFRRNIHDYMAACDLLLHPSCNEASNSTVKEMALQKKTAIVCRDTGDFNDYLVHGQNAFLVNKQNPLEEMKKLLEEILTDTTALEGMGKKLYDDVMNRFSVNENNMKPYLQLLNAR